ncbi:unnamed protein product, partial [Didymodactylos carnosus]
QGLIVNLSLRNLSVILRLVVVLFLSILHLLFLHDGGSRNPLGVSTKLDKIEFH